MKRLFLILSVITLIALLFGVVKASSLPDEIKAPTTVLNYEHEGKFDYLVYLKPSYLFGPEPQEPPPPQPPPPDLKYPIDIIDHFDLTFAYRFVPDRPVERTSEEAEVRAIVNKVGAEEEPPPANLKYPIDIIKRFKFTFNYRFVPDRPVKSTSEEVEVRATVKKADVEEEVILMPRTSKTGDFTISFPLKISDNISDSDIIINAYVYTTFETDTGLIFEDFTQSLPIRSRGALYEVDGDLNHTELGYVGELNYEQHGEFNYEVLLKSDSPFGPITITPEPLTPKTPGTEDTGEIILIPRTSKTGDFTVSFPLNISDNILGSDIIISAYVYTTFETDTGPIFEVFTQTLAIRSMGAFCEVDGDLNHTELGYVGELNYEQQGEFDYEVYLKPNSPFGAIALEPPQISQPATSSLSPPAKAIGPGEVIFPELVDRMDAIFKYDFRSDQPVTGLAEEVRITAILENPEVWSKTFVLVPLTKKSGSFSISFPLDINYFNEMLEAIRSETEIPAESYELTVKAEVYTSAQTDFGPIDEVFSQTLSSTLVKGTLEWNEELVLSQPGAIEVSGVIPNPNKYLGLPVSGVRILAAVMTVILFSLSLYLLWLNLKVKPVAVPKIEKEIRLANKKYGERMAEAVSQTPVEGEKIISVSSMEDLIKIADELGKPVIHQVPSTPKEAHIYYVFDGATRYQYQLVTDSQGISDDYIYS